MFSSAFFTLISASMSCQAFRAQKRGSFKAAVAANLSDSDFDLLLALDFYFSSLYLESTRAFRCSIV